MFTSHYEPERCFDETRDGTFPVIVHGDWLPRHIAGRLHILFASVRSLWLAARVCVRPTRYDVLIVDQVPHSILLSHSLLASVSTSYLYRQLNSCLVSG